MLTDQTRCSRTPRTHYLLQEVLVADPAALPGRHARGTGTQTVSMILLRAAGYPSSLPLDQPTDCSGPPAKRGRTVDMTLHDARHDSQASAAPKLTRLDMTVSVGSGGQIICRDTSSPRCHARPQQAGAGIGISKDSFTIDIGLSRRWKKGGASCTCPHRLPSRVIPGGRPIQAASIMIPPLAAAS